MMVKGVDLTPLSIYISGMGFGPVVAVTRSRWMLCRAARRAEKPPAVLQNGHIGMRPMFGQDVLGIVGGERVAVDVSPPP